MAIYMGLFKYVTGIQDLSKITFVPILRSKVKFRGQGQI